jgi:UDP-N-acetylglucosamine 1-carboxyvinyltransferase
MGADITTLGQSTAIIRGKTPLFGTEVKAENLRAGAALILAGLLANGTTHVKDMYHVYRGYEDIVGKLQTLGAHVQVIVDES